MSKREYPNELTKLKLIEKNGIEEKIVDPVVSNKSQWIQVWTNTTKSEISSNNTILNFRLVWV